MDNNIFVSTYMLQLPDKKTLEEFLLKQLEEELWLAFEVSHLGGGGLKAQQAHSPCIIGLHDNSSKLDCNRFARQFSPPLPKTETLVYMHRKVGNALQWLCGVLNWCNYGVLKHCKQGVECCYTDDICMVVGLWECEKNARSDGCRCFLSVFACNA